MLYELLVRLVQLEPLAFEEKANRRYKNATPTKLYSTAEVQEPRCICADCFALLADSSRAQHDVARSLRKLLSPSGAACQRLRQSATPESRKSSSVPLKMQVRQQAGKASHHAVAQSCKLIMAEMLSMQTFADIGRMGYAMPCSHMMSLAHVLQPSCRPCF